MVEMWVGDCSLTFSKVRMIFEFLGEELGVWSSFVGWSSGDC